MKIVLAYSGGLDTTAVVARYTDEGHEVVAAYGELGQPGELEQASAGDGGRSRSTRGPRPA